MLVKCVQWRTFLRFYCNSLLAAHFAGFVCSGSGNVFAAVRKSPKPFLGKVLKNFWTTRNTRRWFYLASGALVCVSREGDSSLLFAVKGFFIEPLILQASTLRFPACDALIATCVAFLI